MENISAMKLHFIGMVTFLAIVHGESRKVRKK
jgi:hypothetical protein